MTSAHEFATTLGLRHPIRIYQCKDDCCLVQVPSKRFWYMEVPGLKKFTTTSFRELADMLAGPDDALPLEVTA